ncbi:19617_t:CDS:1, partial [Dentiscutata erythropus]
VKHIDKTDEVVKQQTDQASTYIDDSVSSIIEEKLNGEDSVYTLSTEILTEESTQEISRGLKVVEEAGYSISAKVDVPEVPALPKSETEDKPVDNESKLKKS